MMRIAPLLAVVLVALWAHDAAASLHSGKKKFLHGDYRGAREDLANVEGKDRVAAQLMLIRVEIRMGEYESAEKRARQLVKKGGAETDARVLLAEIYRLTGRYTEARRELEPLVAAKADHLRARYVLGLVLRDLGQVQRAAKLFDAFFEDFNSGKIDQNDAEDLFYVAEAARYVSAFEDANHTYREAVGLAPDLLEANLEWGYLGLQKYAVGLAEQSFDEVLKIDAHHPDAHNGMALVKLEQNYDLAAALHHLGKALQVNPRHVPSLLTKAGLEIDQNQWDAARATLAKVFAINEMNFHGRALLATIHWLRDDMQSYEAERKKVLAANPAFAEFFHIVARSAVREHRYKEAIALEQEAVKVNPEYYEAMGEVGSGYLRLGQEKEGLEWLRRSWKGDEYNVRTYNTLNLFEEDIPKQYSFAESKYFRLRYPNDEKSILRRYIEPLLEHAFEKMSKQYGFRPKTPVIIELFRDPQHYSVRTVGLPNLGALGVCFGQVITAMSPSVGDINWGMVLWHELAHVFAIQMSNSRVPRWYTEGLSEYETLMARPEWRREHDAEVYAALQGEALPSVAELNYHFMKPSMQQVVVAYYLSALTIEYIAATHGFGKVVEGLKLFGQGKETPEVIERITGQKVSEFDASFRNHLDQRLAPYRGTFRLPLEGYDDVKKLRAAAQAGPRDAGAQAALALGHYYDGDATKSRAAADAALALDPKNRIALYVKAEVLLRARDLGEAKKNYKALIAAGGDGFDVRGRLAMIARQEGDLAEAEAQLCAAKALDPERSYPYMELFEIYEAMGRKDDALVELETYVMLEQMQYAPLKQLVDGYARKKSWAKVRTYGELALNINLFDAELYLALGDAYRETGDADRALFTYDSALMVQPALRRPALAHIGRTRAFLAKKQRGPARNALAQALKLEPENAEALALRNQVR
jgi:cellulose synthase operon protein C